MMQTLDVYLPQDRRAALAAGEGLPDRASGAALFADISGFTPLTEALARELGPQRGAETISEILNAVYGALIAEVDRFGGSVLGFSGDAITCWFDDAAGHAAPRATTCALAMQRAMAPFGTVTTPGGAAVSLAIKVAVAGGAARRFLAGDPRYGRVDVIAGRTLDRLADAEQQAARGEVVVDGSTAALLGDRLVVAELRGQAGVAVVTGLADAAEASPWRAPDQAVAGAAWWLHPDIARRLDAGPAAFPAELRPAVALFLGYRGIDYDADEDAPLLLDAFTRHVQTVAARYDGTLLQLTMGDKGGYLLISFGAPTAHDDDAARAVGCGQELLVPPPEIGFVTELRVGIARGAMYCGAYGSPTRRTYGVLSDSTNLAARLMQAAPAGELRCDAETASAAHRAWEFAELPALRLKGKAGLTRLFRPAGRRKLAAEDADATRGALLGREPELERITALVEALQGGSGGVLRIEGHGGIGKSRLVDELRRMCARRGVAHLDGAGQSIERQSAYRAWRDLFEGYFRLDSQMEPPERRRVVQAAVVEALPKLVQRTPLLNDVLNLQLEPTPLTAALDVALRHESLQGLLAELLARRASERPMVVILEDAHWLDSRSWELVVRLARLRRSAGLPLLLVLALRPQGEDAAAAHLGALADLGEQQVLSLAPLPDRAIVALAAARVGLSPHELPPEAARLIAERAGGNPFFAEELALALRDRGSLTLAEGQQVGSAGARTDLRAEAPLPGTLQGLILARIDQLPPDQQLTLKVASVIGRTFAERPLHAILSRYRPVDGPTLWTNLVELALREFTQLAAVEPDLAYLFRHIITHEVTYQTLLFAQRRQLHRAAAEWYEASGADLAPLYPLLAHHYRQAEERERERRYARLAGEQAASRYANAEAVAYLGRAIELTPAGESGGRFELLLRREQVLDLLGDRETQAAELSALALLADELGGERPATVALRQANYAEVTGDFAAARGAAERAVELARQAGSAASEAAAFVRWGRAHVLQAEYEQAREPLERGRAIARGAGLAEIEADSLRNLGLASLNRSAYEEALAYADQAIAVFRAAGDRRGESATLANRGAAAYFQGDYAAARAAVEAARAIAQEIGDRLGESDALASLGAIAREQGDFDGARAIYHRALRLAREIGDCWSEGIALNGLGVVAGYQARYGEAIGWQEQAVALCRANGIRLFEGVALVNRAEGLIALGRYAEAAEAAAAGLELFEEAGDRRNAGWALAVAALLDEHRGDREAAVEQAERAARECEQVGARSEQALALTVLGHALLGLGRPSEAEAAYQESLALRRGLDERRLALDTLAGLARAALLRGEMERALGYAEEIIAFAGEQGGLHGAAEPLRIYAACAEVLRAAGDPRAEALLAEAQALVEAIAGTIADEETRRAYRERAGASGIRGAVGGEHL